jgi:hypothetical protein
MTLNKNKIRALMEDYSNNNGNPDPKEFLEKHLNPCWTYLLKHGVVEHSWMGDYKKAAVYMYQQWFLRNRK